MKIVSLDQSSSATGFAYFLNGKLKNYWLIKPKSSKKATKVTVEKSDHLISIVMPESDYGTTLLRISYISDEVEKLIKKIKPNVVYFEEIFNASNPKGFRSLARLQGFICSICWRLKLPYHIVMETEWIKTFGKYDKTIKRPQRKADIMAKVNKLYGLNIKTDDVSDAIAIGTYAVEKEK